MKTKPPFRRMHAVLALLFAMACLPGPLLACATCFGKSDDPLARGMNMGILSLLVVILFVLGAIATFFIYLARRASRFPSGLPAEMDQTTH